ncbi:hypothetical protein P775_00175 [Puniceibacterium antarcticum]|uniref:High-affinity zinc uptake system protein ZnuA n=1 Tax=Puniceibacterium antarcticum TaxID=1206336 RepID=A0A2G8RKY6_9RHOB|nr:zinc ABC transporter substrate-binding protein [Puniceibacterium antarcticum]PIL22245.1 hypothetical protein P775_00175 [Puniceibacterium antarcticum]
MKHILLPLLLASAAPVLADVPKVATDITPVQGLVAAVMGDLGEPALVVPRGSSPHDFALRPSEARALQEANLVVWIGPDLLPNLVKPLSSLAEGAQILTLAELPGTHLLENRSEAVFGGGDEHGDHAESEEDDHDHAEGEDHDHDHADGTEHEHEADHDHDEAQHHDHSHAAHDPHTWMDPDNATLWLDAIATELSALDAENAGTYRANADEAKAAIAEAVAQSKARLSEVHDMAYLSLHDAYQYYEQAFDLHPMGAISLSDASAPGPARLAELRDLLAQGDVTCVLAEPGGPEGYLNALGDGDTLKVTEVDPLGSALPEGAGFYPALISDTADKIANCLTPAS